MKLKVERVQTWEGFRKQLVESRPEEIFYAQGLAPLARPPVELRLIFTSKSVQYVFIDTAEEGVLRRTRLPVSTDRHGNSSLSENDIKKFIHSELGREDVRIRSFELMGGY